jgi:hypothetical protein
MAEAIPPMAVYQAFLNNSNKLPQGGISHHYNPKWWLDMSADMPLMHLGLLYLHNRNDATIIKSHADEADLIGSAETSGSIASLRKEEDLVVLSDAFGMDRYLLQMDSVGETLVPKVILWKSRSSPDNWSWRSETKEYTQGLPTLLHAISTDNGLSFRGAVMRNNNMISSPLRN